MRHVSGYTSLSRQLSKVSLKCAQAPQTLPQKPFSLWQSKKTLISSPQSFELWIPIDRPILPLVNDDLHEFNPRFKVLCRAGIRPAGCTGGWASSWQPSKGYSGLQSGPCPLWPRPKYFLCLKFVEHARIFIMGIYNGRRLQRCRL